MAQSPWAKAYIVQYDPQNQNSLPQASISQMGTLDHGLIGCFQVLSPKSGISCMWAGMPNAEHRDTRECLCLFVGTDN